MIANPASFPEPSKLTGAVFNEPIVKATIVAPQAYLGSLLELCQAARGVQLAVEYLNTESVLLKYTLPLNEILAGAFRFCVLSLQNSSLSFLQRAAATASIFSHHISFSLVVPLFLTRRPSSASPNRRLLLSGQVAHRRLCVV